MEIGVPGIIIANTSQGDQCLANQGLFAVGLGGLDFTASKGFSIIGLTPYRNLIFN